MNNNWRHKDFNMTMVVEGHVWDVTAWTFHRVANYLEDPHWYMHFTLTNLISREHAQWIHYVIDHAIEVDLSLTYFDPMRSPTQLKLIQPKLPGATALQYEIACRQVYSPTIVEMDVRGFWRCDTDLDGI